MEFLMSSAGVRWLKSQYDLFGPILSKNEGPGGGTPSKAYRVVVEECEDHITIGPHIALESTDMRMTTVFVVGRCSRATNGASRRSMADRWGPSALEAGLRFASTTSWDYISGIYTIIRTGSQCSPVGLTGLDLLAERAVAAGQRQLIIIIRGYDGFTNGKDMVEWFIKWQDKIRIFVMVYQKSRGPGSVGRHPFAATQMSDSEQL